MAQRNIWRGTGEMTIKLLTMLGVLLCMALAACTPSNNTDRAMTGLNEVLQSRTLRAAYINYPPSLSVDPNTKAKSGIMADVAAQASQAMNLKLQYVEETTFANMAETLNSGRV